MNEQEKNMYFKLDLTKLKTEREVLTTRKEYFRRKLEKIDHEFIAFIESQPVPEVVKKKLEEDRCRLAKKCERQERSIPKRKLRKIIKLVAITLIIVSEQKKEMVVINIKIVT